jgi:hypothetical protein
MHRPRSDALTACGMTCISSPAPSPNCDKYFVIVVFPLPDDEQSKIDASDMRSA